MESSARSRHCAQWFTSITLFNPHGVKSCASRFHTRHPAERPGAVSVLRERHWALVSTALWGKCYHYPQSKLKDKKIK